LNTSVRAGNHLHIAAADAAASLFIIPPVGALRTTVPGKGKGCTPVGKVEMNPTGWPRGVMDVKFREYAAEEGMPQLD